MENPETTERMSATEFLERGYLQEVNRLVLHPLGVSLEIEDLATGKLGVWNCQDDPEGFVFSEIGDDLSTEKATAVANEIEERGTARIAGLGYVVQPVDVEAKQLSITVKEHTDFRIGPHGEIDAGEERPA